MSKERLISNSPDSEEDLQFPITYEPSDSRHSEAEEEALEEGKMVHTVSKLGLELNAAFWEYHANAGYQNPGFANSGACGMDSSTQPPTDGSNYGACGMDSSAQPPIDGSNYGACGTDSSVQLPTDGSNYGACGMDSFAQPPTDGSNQTSTRCRVTPRSCRHTNPSEPTASAQASCFLRCVAKLALKARRITHTWSFIAFMFAHLIGPIAYFYIGVAYSQNCPYLNYFSLYFLLKGASGLMAVVASVIVLIIKKVSDQDVSLCDFISNIACFLFWGIHAVEFFSILNSGVLFKNFPLPRMCHPVFYRFAIHSLWVVPVLGLPLLFLIVLKSYAPSLEIYLN